MRSFVCGLVLSLACFVQGANPRFLVNKQFSPRDLPQLKLWMDAWNIPSGPVALAPDLSGNGAHFIQSTPMNRPTSVPIASGGHYLAFDGVNDYLTGTSVSTANDFTLSWYIKFDSTGTERHFGDYTAIQMYKDTNNKIVVVAGGMLIGSMSIKSNVWYNICIIKRGTIVTLYIDGIYDKSASVTMSSQTVAYLGCLYTLADPYFLDGSIAEYIAINRAITDSEIIQINTYLHNKWRDMTPVASIDRLQPWMYARDDWRLERQFTLPVLEGCQVEFAFKAQRVIRSSAWAPLVDGAIIRDVLPSQDHPPQIQERLVRLGHSKL